MRFVPFVNSKTIHTISGRHALGTIVGLGRAASKLTVQKRKELKSYVTLLDIHPAMMARNLLFFLMIDALVQDKFKLLDRLEIQATMVYVFVGWVMPSNCEKRRARNPLVVISNPIDHSPGYLDS